MRNTTKTHCMAINVIYSAIRHPLCLPLLYIICSLKEEPVKITKEASMDTFQVRF